MKDIDVKYLGLKGTVKKQTLTEQQLNELIEMQLKSAAIKKGVSDRATEAGDEIIFDYAGFMGEEQFPGGTAERQTLTLGSNMFIPGFEDQCIGRTAGESFDVNVTFPKDYAAPMLAGQDAVFHCKLHSIWREEAPALDDAFAKKASPCSTVAEYREYIRAEAQRSLDNQARFAARDDLMKQMVDSVELEVSKDVVNAELDVMMAELSDQLTLQGFGIDQYCEYTGKSKEYLRAEMLTDALFRVRLNILLDYIAEKENIVITDEEVDEVITQAAGEYEITPDEARDAIGEYGMISFRQDLLHQKTENFILDHAELIEE